ncbi:hypothetical protein CBS147346_1561 [Aspergillus niger]|nr:hypothetical protein CBS147346_1561 [Aspergillus niger]
MAVEALRQLPWVEPNLTSIEIKDANFLHAIRFAERKEELETQLTLTTAWTKASADIAWSQFRLFVNEDGSYIECCRGFIRGSANSQARIPEPPFTGGTSFQNWVAALSYACQSPENAYDNPTRRSVQYGPSFQNLKNMRLGSGGKAIAHIDLGTWKSGPSDRWSSQYTVHPVTMDGLAQLVVPALAYEFESLPTMVPVRAASIWINPSKSCMLNDREILAAAQCSRRGNRGAGADIIGTSSDGSQLVLYIEGLETTFIEDVSAGQRSEIPRNLCTGLVWKADIDMLSNEQLLEEICRGRPSEPYGALQRHESLQLVILGFLDEAITYIDQHPNLSVPLYLRRYVDWMRYQRHRPHDRLLTTANKCILQDKSAQNELILKLENTDIECYFFMHIARNLIAILSGEVDPLDVMFRNGLADRHYEHRLANEHHAYPISRYLDLQCFKNPSVKVLEVGAGTGGQTLCALQALCSQGVKKCAQYDYTDISPGFFAQAQEKFRDYFDIIRFRTCDISKDPVPQSFEPGTYDIVLASHVLHATDRLDVSLQSIRKLLKPGGKLLLIETTDPDALQIPFAYGLLKGWWSPLGHEARSEFSPCLTLSQWDECLKKNGFSGIDIETPGQGIPVCQYSSIIVSSATAENREVIDTVEDLILIREPTQAYQCEVAATIALDHRALIRTLDEAAQLHIGPSTVIIVLLELETSLLSDISHTDYALLQRIMVEAKNVLWVTRPFMKGEFIPQHSLVEGFGRTLASEDSTRNNYTTTNVSNPYEADRHYGDELFNLRKDLKIPRVSHYEHMNNIIHQYTRGRREEQWYLDNELGSVRRAATLELDASRYSNDVAYQENSESLDSTITDDEVIIRVEAFGLTPRDYLAASGQLGQSSLSTQCSGIIQQAAAASGFKVGDRVCAIGTGMAGTLIREKATAVAAIPSDLSFTQAAALPTPLWLAFYSLNHLTRLEADETLLIHQASTSVGQMVVQLALERGGRVLATTDSEAQKVFVCATLGLSESEVLLSDDPLLAPKLKQATDGQGLNVIIGSFDADASLNIARCLAPCGWMVDISWGQLFDRKAHDAHTIFQEAMGYYLGKPIRPPQSISTYMAGKEQEALRQYQETDMIGDPVIEFKKDIPITVNCSSKYRCIFSSDFSYVIAGGLGGLGRSFARWMVSRGARQLILLSRSGPSTPTAQALVKDLENLGVRVATPKVDISKINHLKEVFAHLSGSMPPIRGCIQATVALRDNLFENMSHEDWTTSIDSKVAGSWNLHRVLPHDLDFFVLLSSVNGIFGNRGQANYAAGNTFKDALAHHRLAQKQKAVSIDLGLMVGEGMVAESEFLLTAMRRIGHLMEIAQEELLALLDYYCDPNLPLLSRDEAQVIVGIELPADVTAKGIDLHHSIRRPVFSHLFRMGSRNAIEAAKSSSNASDKPEMVDRPTVLKELPSVAEATEQIVEWVAAKIAHVLGLSASDIDPAKPVHTYGMDSLVAVDLKNWFDREIGASITVFDLMGNTPLRRLSEMAAEKSRYRA